MVTPEQVTTGSWYAEYHYGQCTRTVGPRGGITERIVRCRPNGAVKTWKTRPGEFRLPIKHGLRDCAYITQSNAHLFHAAADCPLNATEAAV